MMLGRRSVSRGGGGGVDDEDRVELSENRLARGIAGLLHEAWPSCRAISCVTG